MPTGNSCSEFFAEFRAVARRGKTLSSDFLCKPVDRQTLLAAIETALATASNRALPATSEPPTGATLTERETAVLRSVIAGRLNKQIAADMDLSERTIKSCRADLMRKLGAGSLAELVRLAVPLLASR